MAKRRRKRRRTYNTMRTDALESWIAYYRAQRNHEAATAVKQIALEVEAPISEEEIAKLQKQYEADRSRRHSQQFLEAKAESESK